MVPGRSGRSKTITSPGPRSSAGARVAMASAPTGRTGDMLPGPDVEALERVQPGADDQGQQTESTTPNTALTISRAAAGASPRAGAGLAIRRSVPRCSSHPVTE